jgi:uncharacterized protein (DUF427 family)
MSGRMSPAASTPLVEAGRVEPAPKRIRALLGGAVVLDTRAALYAWTGRSRPELAIPAVDVDRALLTGELGPPEAVTVHGDDAPAALAGTVRIAWDACDAWFEEDEQMLVGPRSPYTRLDALRSSRVVRAELDGVLLTESAAPVALFETGLPTRWYVDRAAVRFEHLLPSDSMSACPYKGVASDWWSARVDGLEHADVCWSYPFPTREVAPIAGLVAFDDSKVTLTVDGEATR